MICPRCGNIMWGLYPEYICDNIECDMPISHVDDIDKEREVKRTTIKAEESV
jgi:hypothetical protein